MFTLNIGTELEQVLTLISVVISVALLAFAWNKLAASPLKLYFLLALGFLPLYLNLKLFLEADHLLSPAGVFDIWFRHFFFYVGQLCFFAFVSKIFTESESGAGARAAKLVVSVLAALYAGLLIFPQAVLAFHTVNIFQIPKTPYNIILFLTDEGVQHIVAILSFFIILSIARIQTSNTEFAQFRKVTLQLLFANGFFVLVHFWEYLAESLHFFQFLTDEFVEGVEYMLQFSGLVFFFYFAFVYLKSKEIKA